MSGSQQLLLGSGQGAAPAVDPYFYSVTSLLHGDGTNGGQNNTFLDSSSNNFTITRNGNTTQGSFSPFSQTGWSGYFDGSGDYCTLSSNASMDFGAGNFTIECFVNTGVFSVSAGASRTIIGNSGNSYTMQLYIDTTSGRVVFGNTGSTFLQGTGTVADNQWHHIVVVRSGTGSNQTAIFVDGQRQAVGTNSQNYSSGTIYLGAFDTGNGFWNGYISNLRIVKGTAVYDPTLTTLTVPTTPLTAVSNTALLTLQSNRFLDNSTNAYTVTKAGDTSIQPFSPFNPTTPYSTSSIGGSGYFDGSGDYLSVASNNTIPEGNEPYTVEAWVRINTTSQVDLFAWGEQTANKYTAVTFNFGGTGNILHFWWSNDLQATGTNVSDGAWHHVAFTYDGTTRAIYLDGVRVASDTPGTHNVTVTNNLTVGFRPSGTAYAFNGYMSGFRIVTNAAIYSGTTYIVPAVPPTTTVSSGTVTTLLNFTNGAIFDNAAVADYETVGNAQISTSVKKYGTGSMAFDGTGDYLSAADSQAFNFGSGDWTIEAWLYINTAKNYNGWFGKRQTSQFGLTLQIDSSNVLSISASTTGSSWALAGASLGGGYAPGAWMHVAVTRLGNTITGWLNGTKTGTQTLSGSIFPATGYFATVGSANDSSQELNGYIDDFRISKGVARYPYNFTPPTAEFPNIGGTVTLTADPYFDYTTLLLPGNGTNGAQNNTFLDSSTNAFSITRNGNTTQGTFSPFSQTGWGNYFDGTGDTLSLADDNALDLGTGDFSIEGWVYLTGFPGSGANAFISKFASGNYAYLVQIISASTLRFYTGNSGSLSSYYDYTYTWVLNQWTHIAITRESGTLRAFVNGTLLGSNASVTQNLTNTSTLILGNNGDGGGQDFNGYMSNVRIVKGTAVYTANFTPSTTPLTAISGTSLLTCQSNRFIDNSSNAFAITRNGDVSVQAFSPFNPTTPYSTSSIGGSGYFDGSGDYLDASASAGLGGSGNFTLQAWIYPTTVSGDCCIYETRGGTGWVLFINSTGYLQVFDSAASLQTASTTQLRAYQWTHIALVKNGSTCTYYVNGSAAGTFTLSSFAAATRVRIGARNDAAATYFGWISSLRTDTTNLAITVPTGPLTAGANTNYLLNFTNAGIYDATSKNDLETVGNAQISTTQSKFGGSSMYFDGSGDYLKLIGPAAPSQYVGFGTGDFTIEAWLYITSSTVANNGIYDARYSASATGPLLYYIPTSGMFMFYNGSNTISGGTITINTWTHVALVRYNGVTKLYLNGTQSGSNYTDANNYTSGVNSCFVGAFYDGTASWNGYIDDFRVTRGIARYTSNFTPPTTAFLTL